VKLGTSQISDEQVAVKIMSLQKVSRQQIRKEICIQKMLKHLNVVRFLGYKADGDIMFVLLQLADGGELFDRIGALRAPHCTHRAMPCGKDGRGQAGGSHLCPARVCHPSLR